jgi:uncharacterized protein (DUF2126 family)
MDDAMMDEVREHDACLARHGLDIWIGSEPTFTHTQSSQACWFTEAVGGEKEAHARALLLALAPRLGGAVELLRVQGRSYPGEQESRFCMGALFARRGAAGATPPSVSELDAEALAATPTPNEQQAWLTVTPDPGVVEVNMAPAHNLATFAAWSADIYTAAQEAGLSPIRFRYNGEVTDSGGGGQITLGGPSPQLSPFFLRPQLLPGLVRYLNRHPSLSYWFAPSACGSASQGPRPDESVRERFAELPIALDFLAARGDDATPTELWGMLAPLLVDATGSSHRSELNIEKLWNPWSPRGQLGLVELRALRMPSSAARLTAIAALFRALAARLAVEPYLKPVEDWGAKLHDRFGLPWHLERDLEHVLADLDLHGFGLGPRMRAELLWRPEPIATLTLDDASLEVRPALSFWPLLGDLASWEQRGARLVDSSSTRVQLLLRAPAGASLGLLGANGWRVPLQPLAAEANHAALGSVIYRAFTPNPGLHPAIPKTDPLRLEWVRGGRGVRLALHAWQPSGGSYQGLPNDADEASGRRRERVVVSSCGEHDVRLRHAHESQLDLRRLARAQD